MASFLQLLKLIQGVFDRFGSHLFQRVASFLQIIKLLEGTFERLGSHLFQRVASFLPIEIKGNNIFVLHGVLISFREWLHSYKF